MKILFVGFNVDYQQAMILHGLRSIYGNEVVDIPFVEHHYDNQSTSLNLNSIHGKGFGIFGLLDKDLPIDREDIVPKLQKKFFDICIFSLNPGIYIPEFNKLLNMARDFNNKVVLIDGRDQSENAIEQKPGEIYFKRERYYDDGHSLPICFAFPKEKISSLILAEEKLQFFSSSQPKDLHLVLQTINDWPMKKPIQVNPDVIDDKNINVLNIRDFPYISNAETEYYRDYQQSCFGLTMKKGGWDSQRTLEILFNSSLPYFMDIEYCPTDCMFIWPKDLLMQVKQLSIFKDVQEPVAYNVTMDKFNSSQIYKDEYNDLLIKMYSYAKEHLTTEAMAKYVMSRIESSQ